MIYLDTNAIYYFFFEDEDFTPKIKKELEKIQSNKEKAITSCLTLDEFAYVALLTLVKNKYKKSPRAVLAKDKKIVLEFVDKIEEAFQTIFSFDNLEIVEANKDISGSIPNVMKETLLLPKDCIHLNTMRNFRVTRILSTDSDFDNIPQIERVKPE